MIGSTKLHRAMRRVAGIRVVLYHGVRSPAYDEWLVIHDDRVEGFDSEQEALAFANKLAAEVIEAGDVPATREWTIVRDTDGSPLRMEL